MTEIALPRLPIGSAPLRLLSDQRLVARAARGDERAFAAIFERYHQQLYRYCTGLVGNAADAQDALQNTMVKALRAMPHQDGEIQLKPWLYRIAHNESIDLIRSRRPSAPLGEAMVDPMLGPAAQTESRARLRELVSDLQDLSEGPRSALVMKELSGLSGDEIAEALGTTPQAARQTVYEARLALAEMKRGRDMTCEMVRLALSEGDRRIARRRDLRAHLRCCQGCGDFAAAVKDRRQAFGLLSPLPAAASAAIFGNLFGGGSSGGSGLAALAGGGASKALATSAAIKSVAGVAAVTAIGISAAGVPGVGALPLVGGEERHAGAHVSLADPAAGVSGTTAAQALREQGSGGSLSRGGPRSGGAASHNGLNGTGLPAADRGVTRPSSDAHGAGTPSAGTTGTSGPGPETGRDPAAPSPAPTPGSSYGQQTAATHSPVDPPTPSPGGRPEGIPDPPVPAPAPTPQAPPQPVSTSPPVPVSAPAPVRPAPPTSAPTPAPAPAPTPGGRPGS